MLYFFSFFLSLIRPCLRFLSLCLLASAFIVFVIDAMRSYGAATLSLTPLGDALVAYAPEKWAASQSFLGRHVHLMNAVTAEFLRLPVWFVLAVTGVLIAWLGKKPPPKFGFSSR